VCTGFWFSQNGGVPDSPGCYPFCQNDAECVGVVNGDAGTMFCNNRTGRCSNTGVNPTLRADGEPCNPMEISTTGRAQCRGLCFAVSAADRTRGNCGSFLNIQVTPTCPDRPTEIQPITRANDNQGICIFRTCMRNADCTSPHVCVYPEDAAGVPVTTAPPNCLYPTASQPNGIR
jgi:hypothetical protein